MKVTKWSVWSFNASEQSDRAILKIFIGAYFNLLIWAKLVWFRKKNESFTGITVLGIWAYITFLI